ncbi:MAG: rhodanese-like domain-containing protein [Acidobacteriia bacterium]|nr:rhodanese-like domain-containing protein [Terriglobia bacterium]
MNKIREIEPEEVRRLQEAGKSFVFLDVREPWEVSLVHLEGALSIPLGNLYAAREQLNPEDEIVVFCHRGIRSQLACQHLSAQGFKSVYNLSGGIDAWAARLDPTLARY